MMQHHAVSLSPPSLFLSFLNPIACMHACMCVFAHRLFIYLLMPESVSFITIQCNDTANPCVFWYCRQQLDTDPFPNSLGICCCEAIASSVIDDIVPCGPLHVLLLLLTRAATLLHRKYHILFSNTSRYLFIYAGHGIY